MKFGLSFLATEFLQLDPCVIAGADVVEGVLFDRVHLESPHWDIAWSNVMNAAKKYGSEYLTFHFPVNNSDYVNDSFVKGRLIESYGRACDLGLGGIVVHANRCMPIESWQKLSPEDERLRVVERLVEVKNSNVKTETWIGLENMPIMDNNGDIIDPTFVFPEDFSVLQGTGIGITWDICHYLNSIETCKEVVAGKQPLSDFPNFKVPQIDGYNNLNEKIVHWHFSGFVGIPNRRRGLVCKEGVLPWKGTLGEKFYKEALKNMLQVKSDARCIFEVSEESYKDRVNGAKMIRWSKDLLD